MASLRRWNLSFVDLRAGLQMGRAINTPGGTFVVCKSGLPERMPLFNKDGSVLAQPLAINTPLSVNPGVAGALVFFTQSSGAAHDTIDIYGILPGGQFVMYQGLQDSNLQELNVDLSRREQTCLIPFSFADAGAGVEFKSGIQLPAGCVVSPFQAVNVTVLEATRTLNYGILSTEAGGNASGFGTGVSLAAKTQVSLQSAATTSRGALIGAATLDHEYVVAAGSQVVSYTLSAGTTVAEGFLEIPYRLPFAA